MGNWLIFRIRDFRSFVIENLWNFSESKSLEFSKFENKQISRIWKFGRLSKVQKLANCRIVCPFNIWHHSQFRPLIYIDFDALTSRFLFPIYFSYSRKVGCYTFKRPLIVKFKISAILKFYCSKFQHTSKNLMRSAFQNFAK